MPLNLPPLPPEAELDDDLTKLIREEAAPLDLAKTLGKATGQAIREVTAPLAARLDQMAKVFPMLGRITAKLIREQTAPLAARLDAMAPPPATNLDIVIVPGAWGTYIPGMHSVLAAIAAQLLRHFPQPQPHRRVELYHDPTECPHVERDASGAYRVRTSHYGNYWCYLTFEFSHELAHIALGHTDGFWGMESEGYSWEHETLAQLASLFTLRQLARTWTLFDSPGYAPAFDNFADGKIAEYGGAQPYAAVRERLQRSVEDRDANGAVACTLLPLFMAQPALWREVCGTVAPLTTCKSLAHVFA